MQIKWGKPQCHEIFFWFYLRSDPEYFCHYGDCHQKNKKEICCTYIQLCCLSFFMIKSSPPPPNCDILKVNCDICIWRAPVEFKKRYCLEFKKRYCLLWQYPMTNFTPPSSPIHMFKVGSQKSVKKYAFNTGSKF